MAKARLVDFRGGINQKISPHMIGDSQGQDAQSVDLSAVRLNGMTNPVTGDLGSLAGVFRYTNGEHFYDTGDSRTERWISTDPNHNSFTYPLWDAQYIPNSTDFVVWNKDLYVSRKNSSGNDTLIRIVDVDLPSSQSTANPIMYEYALAFSPPAAVDLNVNYYDDIGVYPLDNGRKLYYDEFRETAYRAANTVEEARSPARGVNWAVNRNFDSLSDSGYYLRTVRNYQGIPIESNTATKAEVVGGSFVNGLNNTPNLLTFDITSPSDSSVTEVSNMPLIGYRLYRNDNLSRNVSLGLIYPENVSAHVIITPYVTNPVDLKLSGLENGANYRVKFWGWSGVSLAAGSSSYKANVDLSGSYEYTNVTNNSIQVELYAQDNFEFSSGAQFPLLGGFDLWLEKEVMTDIWAVTGCVSFWKGDTASNGTTLSSSLSGTNWSAGGTGEEHPVYSFIDCFASGLSSGYITSNQDKTAPPNSLKFLAEWNNFFFGVGSEYTSANRYGDNINKKDSFLFVSDYNNPRHWPLDGYVEFPDSITGIYPYKDALIVFTKRAVYRVFGSRANQMRKVQVSTIEGLPSGNHRTIQMVNNFLVWVSTKGVCIYDGNAVTNLTRGRFSDDPLDGATPANSAVYESKYYLVTYALNGLVIDFNLEGFPIIKLPNFYEGTNNAYVTPTGYSVQNPVLEYIPSKHQLYFGFYLSGTTYMRTSILEGYDVEADPYETIFSGRNPNRPWKYRTRAFDGGNFGSIKLIRNVTVNGYGYGTVTIRIDGTVVVDAQTVGAYSFWGQKPEDATSITEPTRVYLPETVAGNPFGLPAGDVWDVELEWVGTVDWIDTEYEILST
jgi:hypothetical protein